MNQHNLSELYSQNQLINLENSGQNLIIGSRMQLDQCLNNNNIFTSQSPTYTFGGERINLGSLQHQLSTNRQLTSTKDLKSPSEPSSALEGAKKRKLLFDKMNICNQIISHENLDDDVPPFPRSNDIPKLSMKNAVEPLPLNRYSSSSISSGVSQINNNTFKSGLSIKSHKSQKSIPDKNNINNNNSNIGNSQIIQATPIGPSPHSNSQHNNSSGKHHQQLQQQRQLSNIITTPPVVGNSSNKEPKQKDNAAASININNDDLNFVKSLNSQQIINSLQHISNNQPHQIHLSPQEIQERKQQLWKRQMLVILVLIHRFIFKLKRAAMVINPRQLSGVQLQAINDASAQNKEVNGGTWRLSFIDVKKMIEQEKKLRQRWGRHTKRVKVFRKRIKDSCATSIYLGKALIHKVQILFRRVPIFDPLHKFALLWEILISLVTLFLYIYLPLEGGFHLQACGYNNSLDWIIPLMLAMDMLVKVNTSYFEHNKQISERYQILINYSQTTMLPDLFTLLCLTPIFSFCQDNLKLLRILFLIRMFYFSLFRQLMSINNKFQAALTLQQRATLKLINLILRIGFFCHLCACAWNFQSDYSVSTLNFNGPEKWINRMQLQGATLSSLYVSALYHVTLCLTGQLGSSAIQFVSSHNRAEGGDLIESTGNTVVVIPDDEKLFFSILSLASLGVLGYSFAVISSVCQDLLMPPHMTQFERKLKEVYQFMEWNCVSDSLKLRVMKHLKFSSSAREEQETNSLIPPSSESLSCVSRFLREEVMREVNMKVLQQVSWLQKNFSQQFLDMLAQRMLQQSYQTEEQIVRAKGVDQPTLYIVRSGEVELYLEIGNARNRQIKSFSKLLTGQCFGELEFLLQDNQVKLSARAVCATLLYKITWNEFSELLKDFPEDREVYCYLRDCLILDRDFQKINVSCLSCKQTDHHILECPFLFYGELKAPIIQKITKKDKEFRIKFNRNNCPKIKGLNNQIAGSIVHGRESQRQFDEIEEQVEMQGRANGSVIDNGIHDNLQSITGRQKNKIKLKQFKFQTLQQLRRVQKKAEEFLQNNSTMILDYLLNLINYYDTSNNNCSDSSFSNFSTTRQQQLQQQIIEVEEEENKEEVKDNMNEDPQDSIQRQIEEEMQKNLQRVSSQGHLYQEESFLSPTSPNNKMRKMSECSIKQFLEQQSSQSQQQRNRRKSQTRNTSKSQGNGNINMNQESSSSFSINVESNNFIEEMAAGGSNLQAATTANQQFIEKPNKPNQVQQVSDIQSLKYLKQNTLSEDIAEVPQPEQQQQQQGSLLHSVFNASEKGPLVEKQNPNQIKKTSSQNSQKSSKSQSQTPRQQQQQQQQPTSQLENVISSKASVEDISSEDLRYSNKKQAKIVSQNRHRLKSKEFQDEDEESSEPNELQQNQLAKNPSNTQHKLSQKIIKQDEEQQLQQWQQQNQQQQQSQQQNKQLPPLEIRNSINYENIENIILYNNQFNTVQTFQHYYPQNNIEQIIENYNQKLKIKKEFLIKRGYKFRYSQKITQVNQKKGRKSKLKGSNGSPLQPNVFLPGLPTPESIPHKEESKDSFK